MSTMRDTITVGRNDTTHVVAEIGASTVRTVCGSTTRAGVINASPRVTCNRCRDRVARQA